MTTTARDMEAARVQPASPFAPAHDSFTRLLLRLEPDPGTRGPEAEPVVEKAQGVLIVDDSTRDQPYAQHLGLVTRHWSGKHPKPVRGLTLITLLGTDGDRPIPGDYRVFSTADGQTKPDPFGERLLRAPARRFSPPYVRFDAWDARLENLKQVRDLGWLGLTRRRGARKVTPADRRRRTLDEGPVAETGTVLPLRGSGMVFVFRIDTAAGATDDGATNDRTLAAGLRPHDAEVSCAIANDHRELNQHGGVERCQARSSRPQRNHIGLALRAFWRLE